MITTILFDLDGTLLPMDQDLFIKEYMARMAKMMASYGYDPERLTGAIWKGTGAMIKNDGTESNYDVFWKVFTSIFGEEARNDEPLFEAYYHTEFQNAKKVCGFSPYANELIQKIKALGFRIALATNPLFPPIATQSRIKWAGMNPDDFELITTYDNSRYCKPNLNYYRDVLNALHVTAEECVMVGNDVGEDMVTAKLGMQVFLMTDCLINHKNEDISQYPHGSFPELMAFVRGLNQ